MQWASCPEWGKLGLIGFSDASFFEKWVAVLTDKNEKISNDNNHDVLPNMEIDDSNIIAHK